MKLGRIASGLWFLCVGLDGATSISIAGYVYVVLGLVAGACLLLDK